MESDDTRGAGATEHVGMAGAWVGRPVEKRDRTSREGIDARERGDGLVGAELQAGGYSTVRLGRAVRGACAVGGAEWGV